MPIKTQANPTRPTETQGTLPFKRRSKGQTIKVPEKVVEREADFELARGSFRFLNTTVRYPFFKVTCPRCNSIFETRNEKGTGQDKGIPDRLVYSRGWWHPLLPATLWLGVELKGSHTPFSCTEQKRLFEDGHTVVAREGVAASKAAREVDAFFDYVEGLEQDVAALLEALRGKVPDWKEKAKAVSNRLRSSAGRGDIDELVSDGE